MPVSRAVRPDALFKLLVPLFALLVILLLVEAGFGLYHWGGSSPFVHRVPDPVLGWRLQPGARYRYIGMDYRARVEYNADGWRDVEPPASGPTAAPRILVLGDSYLEGYTVDLEQTFHRRLQASLRAAGHPGVQVRNLAVGGYGTLQEYLAYHHFGRAPAPDLVVLGFYFGNDLRNNSRVLETRYWPPGSDKALSRPFLLPGPGWALSPVDFAGAQARYRRARERLDRRPWWKATASYRAYGLLRSGYWRLRRASTVAGRHTGASQSCVQDDEYRAAWRTTDRILTRLQREVSASGARLLVFTVPKEGGRQPAKVTLLDGDGRRWNCVDQDAVARLRRLTERRAIAFVDLGPAFAVASADDPQALLVRTEGHWNAAGHRLAAREVAGAIGQRGLLR